MPKTHEELILVERRLFGLMDTDTDACPNPWPAGPRPAGEPVIVRTGRIDFVSAAPDHRALVRLESWDHDPPAPDGTWADEERTEIELPSGTVQLWTLTMGPGTAAFAIGPPGRYALRVWTRGQDAALELSWRSRPVPDATEQYVVQFWPKPAREA
ncbi:hypothetical protein [Streptomyces sp. 4F14]|uniref:hypothetical protein n=1 Tax=Streptomyces sp. 4F14 TaxID=3394380 RepID=UPI003A837959